MDLHEVQLADEALVQLIEIPSQGDYARVRTVLRTLETIPLAGSVYDPAYEAAQPPIECRVMYAGHYGIYYTCDEIPTAPVRVLAIEDQRRNPMNRFADLG